MRLSDIVNRRELFYGAAKSGLVFGTGFASFADFARAQANQDEHFWIFIELRGGIHWMIATDGRDVAKLPMDNPKLVRTLKITDEPLTDIQYNELTSDRFFLRANLDGRFLLLPYIDSLETSYTKGTTGLGCDYILGWCAEAIRPIVDDLAVVRGVHMRGDFHGLDNANGEIFSGLNSSEFPHIAAVLSKELGARYGRRLLDNLVFENASFNTGLSATTVDQPMRLDAQSLGYIVGNADVGGDAAADLRFAKARTLADALSRNPQLSDLHRNVFAAYLGAMQDGPRARAQLLQIKDQLGSVDASLDLGVQCRTALTMMSAGLTRVATLCYGAPNGRNQVDGFGLFDAHRGLYHLYAADDSTLNTQRHHLNVSKAMGEIAALVKTLKETPFGGAGKKMWDVTTVVVGTEFARPSNFFGNEAGGGAGSTAFGAGHYQRNNNYIMFGRGVRGGCWIGDNEPLRQTGATVDLATVAQDDPRQISYTPTEFSFEPAGEGASEADGEGYYSLVVDYEHPNKRPFMARDVVRTVMEIAGVGSRFGEIYSDEKLKNPHVLRPMLKS